MEGSLSYVIGQGVGDGILFNIPGHTPLLLSTARVVSFLFREEHLSTESPGDGECQGALHFHTILAKHAERQYHQEKTSGKPTAQDSSTCGQERLPKKCSGRCEVHGSGVNTLKVDVWGVRAPEAAPVAVFITGTVS